MHNPILVAMLSYNRVDFTQQAIEALYNNTNSVFDLVILDNGSDEDTVKYLKSLKKDNLHIIYEPVNLGVSKGMNVILEHRMKDQHFMKLDNDMVFDDSTSKDWLETIIHLLEFPLEINVNDPRIKKTNVCKIGAIGLKPYKLLPEFENKINVLGINLELPPEGTLGCATVYKNEIFDKIGKFNEEYDKYGYEDPDLNIRLGMSNYITCFWPEIKIAHIDPGGETDYMKWKQLMAVKNNKLYFDNYNDYKGGKKKVKI